MVTLPAVFTAIAVPETGSIWKPSSVTPSAPPAILTLPWIRAPCKVGELKFRLALFTVTVSLYVPAATVIASPAVALSTASWIVQWYVPAVTL